jgi:hypothetical protein
LTPPATFGFISTSAVKPLYILLLLLAVFAFNFSYHDGWKDGQGGGDEPAYIENAYNYWHSGAVPGQITWSPGYAQLMSPFVGLFGKETGFKIWRFVLFAGVSLLVYAVFSQMFCNAWFGFILALYSQMFWWPYNAPSLQSLACLLYLICFLLLTDKKRFLGLTLGIMMNGIFISGAMGFVFVSFGALSLIFYPRFIISRRFLIQFLACAALFGANLHHLGYDIREYPEIAYVRGSAGLYHQLSLLIVSSGRYVPYLKPGEDDHSQNHVGEYRSHQERADEYYSHLKAVDRYYLDKFGEKEADLRAHRHDGRWPALLLDWPWMMSKDPELMKEFAQDSFRELKENLWMAFEIILPVRDYHVSSKSPKRGVFVIPLIFVLLLPHFIGLIRKEPIGASVWPSRLQLLLLLSCLGTLIPLTLVKPLIIYFPSLIPAYLMGVALITSFFINGASLIQRQQNIQP